MVKWAALVLLIISLDASIIKKDTEENTKSFDSHLIVPCVYKWKKFENGEYEVGDWLKVDAFRFRFRSMCNGSRRNTLKLCLPAGEAQKEIKLRGQFLWKGGDEKMRGIKESNSSKQLQFSLTTGLLRDRLIISGDELDTHRYLAKIGRGELKRYLHQGLVYHGCNKSIRNYGFNRLQQDVAGHYEEELCVDILSRKFLVNFDEYLHPLKDGQNITLTVEMGYKNMRPVCFNSLDDTTQLSGKLVQCQPFSITVEIQNYSKNHSS